MVLGRVVGEGMLEEADGGGMLEIGGGLVFVVDWWRGAGSGA